MINELKTEETIEKLQDMIMDFGDGLLEFETRDVNILLNQLTLQENYNDMLVTECENLKSEVVVLEEWRDRHEDNAVKQFEEIKKLEILKDALKEIDASRNYEEALSIARKALYKNNAI
jgi:hypothetical protein